MRARLAVGAGVAVLAALALWAWWPSPAANVAAPIAVTDAPRTAAAPEPEPQRTGSRSISGRVLSADGAPVAEADVDVVFDRAGVVPSRCAALVDGCTCGDELEPALAELDRAFGPLKKTTTGADGRFTIDALPEGEPLRLRAADENSYATAVLPAGTATIELKLTQPLASATQLTGEQGPLPQGAVVAIEGGKVIAFARPDAEGIAVLLAPPAAQVFGFAPGKAMQRPRFRSEASALAADGGWQVKLRVMELAEGKMFHGRLETADAAGLGDVEVRTVEPRLARADDDSELEPPPCSRTRTAADGTYVLGPLADGWYEVEAHSGRRKSRFEISTRHLADNPDASVSSKALEEAGVRGTVLDEDGQPNPEARLQFQRAPSQGGSVTTAAPAIDGHGRFEAHEVAGSFSLAATAPHRQRTEERKQVSENETWEVNLVLKKVVTVSGTVEDASGRPVAGAQLYVQIKLPGSWTGDAATTKADGVFTTEVLPGDFELTCSAPGFKRSAVIRGHSPQAGVRVVLTRGTALEGRVIDEQGAPAAGISVSAQGVDPQDRANFRSEKDGKFRFDTLEEGRCEVRAEEYKTEITNRLPSGSGIGISRVTRSARASVEVTGALGPFVELKLQTVNAVAGRVVDEQGSPVPGARIRPVQVTQPVRGEAQANFQMQVIYQQMQRVRSTAGLMGGNFTLSRPDGTFSLEGIVEPRQLYAEAEGLKDDPTTPVVVSPGSDPVVIRMIHPHYLTGTVTSAQGLPITAVSLEGTPVPAPGGRFNFEVRFPFSGRVFIGADGHVPEAKSVVLSPGADTNIGTIQLTAGRTLSVRTVDQVTGQPILGWFFLGDTFLRGTESGAEKTITIPRGAITLGVSGPEHVETLVPVGADQQALTVPLDPGGAITGTVRELDGKVARGFYVQLLVEGCPKKTWGTMQPDGTFTVLGVGAGNCRISAKRQNSDQFGPAKAVSMPARGKVSADLVVPPT